MFDNAPPSLKLRRTREKYKKQFSFQVAFLLPFACWRDANKGKYRKGYAKIFAKDRREEARRFTLSNQSQK
jgi:hypothetical protein